LVAAVRAGDDRAFERLYERYHRRIAAYIYGMVNDYARAEDIAQDVFMSALRRMRETDRPIAFKPWVYEIAKNACIDQFRRARRAEEVSYDAEEGLGAADYGRLVTTGPAPDVAVDQKMSLDHLCGAFGGLSETHHEILVMRELEGLSYREIGERLGMSRPSVESTLFRARRRLTEEYEELVTGERCRRIQAIITTATTGTLGTRDQRRMARHVSYCQPCRRQARMAGLDSSVLVHVPVRAKIAAFIPLPAFLRRRWGGDSDSLASGVSATHVPAVAQWSAVVSDPSAAGWVKAAATAATVAIAGVGAGAAVNGDSLGIEHALPGASVVRHAGSTSQPAIARSVVAPVHRRVSSGVPAGAPSRRRGAAHTTSPTSPASTNVASAPAKSGSGSGSGSASGAAPASSSPSSPATLPALPGGDPPQRPTSGGQGGGGAPSQSLPAATPPVGAPAGGLPVPTVPDITAGDGSATKSDPVGDVVNGVLGGG
jgi:RNA polymerase sigma factor (sigma-70 family)